MIKVTSKLASATLQLAAMSALIAACSSDNKAAPDAPAQDDAPVQTTPANVKLGTATDPTKASLGSFLTDSNGMTLYLYSKDTPAATGVAAVSNCTTALSATCLTNWPIFHVDSVAVGAGLSAADFSEIMRSDGMKQTTYRGWPLYHFAMDVAAGDVKGEARGNIWYVLRQQTYSMVVMSSIVATAPPLYLATPGGMTLYYYTPDTVGVGATAPVSVCTGTCLTNWPAFQATTTGTVLPTGVADLTTFARTDNGVTTMQAAWKGHPLYTFHLDVKPGDTLGDKVGGVWFVLNPTAPPP